MTTYHPKDEDEIVGQFDHIQTKIQKIINKVGHKRLEIRK